MRTERVRPADGQVVSPRGATDTLVSRLCPGVESVVRDESLVDIGQVGCVPTGTGYRVADITGQETYDQ